MSQSTPILNEDGDPIWKVLVFDNKGRDVISSVLRVNDLRAWGVTIHLYALFVVALLLMLFCRRTDRVEISTRRDTLSPMSLLSTSLNRPR